MSLPNDKSSSSPIVSMDQAVAILGTMHHWTIKTMNRDGERRAHECTINGLGKLVTAQGRTPLAAVTAALAKLRGDSKPLRVFRGR